MSKEAQKVNGGNLYVNDKLLHRSTKKLYTFKGMVMVKNMKNQWTEHFLYTDAKGAFFARPKQLFGGKFDII